MLSRIATAKDAEQLMRDLELLLMKKFPSRKAVAIAMAKELQKNPNSYYSNFIHYIRGTKNISNAFLQDFYKIFHADVDDIKKKQLNDNVDVHSDRIHDTDFLNEAISDLRIIININQELQGLLVRYLDKYGRLEIDYYKQLIPSEIDLPENDHWKKEGPLF